MRTAMNAGGFIRHIHHSLHTRSDKEHQVTLLLQALRGPWDGQGSKK